MLNKVNKYTLVIQFFCSVIYLFLFILYQFNKVLIWKIASCIIKINECVLILSHHFSGKVYTMLAREFHVFLYEGVT